MTLVLLHTA